MHIRENEPASFVPQETSPPIGKTSADLSVPWPRVEGQRPPFSLLSLLALQRRAGNRAVVELLGRGPAPIAGRAELVKAPVHRLMVQRQTFGSAGGFGGEPPRMTSSTTNETLTGFATSSADLIPAHQAALARIAADLNAQPLVFGGFITLVGFADRRGDAGENQALGQRRADAVRDYLQQLVTDETTRREIRAYSLGAPSEGPVGDVPSLRKVEITITRRTFNLELPTPTPSLPGPPGTLSVSVADLMRPLPPSALPPGPRQPQLPDWFWRELPARPPDPSAISQISRWLNETLHTRDLARVGASVAGVFGFNRAQVQRLLENAFQNGGESAVKEVLNAMIQAAAGAPSSPPSSPYGPPIEPIPFPRPQLPLPPIPFR